MSRSLSTVTSAFLAVSVTSCDKEDTSFELHVPRDWFLDNLDAVYKASDPGSTGSKCVDLAKGNELGYGLKSIETMIHSLNHKNELIAVWSMLAYYEKGCK